MQGHRSSEDPQPSYYFGSTATCRALEYQNFTVNVPRFRSIKALPRPDESTGCSKKFLLSSKTERTPSYDSFHRNAYNSKEPTEQFD